jgi:prepilin-type N-terminal cleavage/methylation domain-containing protein
MKKDGFTLIEVLVVIAIIGITASLAMMSMAGWVRKYNVESEIKQLYADLMKSRVTAMNNNRAQFVSLSASQYTIYDDTSPAPNGDGTLQPLQDTIIAPAKSLKYPMVWNGGGNDRIDFNSRGISPPPYRTICVYSDINPSYDCIKVSATRIILGKIITQGVCDADNCEPKK